MGEIGERATQAHGGANVPTVSRDATPTLAGLGIPLDRAENVTPRDICVFCGFTDDARLASQARCRSGQSHRPRQ
jgi:predicted butyrate kinase (DUF1464 family)